jgi:alpha-L-fucosidase 2
MKKIFFSFVLLLCIYASASAMSLKTDIEYANAGGEKQLLDIYEPNGIGPFPAVIVVHGGAWIGGDKQGDEKIFAQPLTDANLVCVSVNYRLAPKHKWPACYEDVQAAIKWVKENGSQYKIDTSRIAIMGYSAGGQIAAMAAMTSENDREVQAIVLVASPTDLVYDGLRRGDITVYISTVLGSKKLDAQALQLLWEISPVNYVRAGLPPFLLIHGTADTTVPCQLSINFKSRLDFANVPYDIILIEGGTHNIKTWGTLDKDYVKKTIEWLGEKLKK